ncbi:MAG TPA: DUF1499 domain-containing protein [Vicinamibacterales bacterium]|nr:DUF1499 domain-containing protein [Vicinamibacterales bacterium]
MALVPFITFGIAAVGFILLAMAGPAYRLGLSLPKAYELMRWAAYVGIVAAVAALATAVLAYRQRKWLGVVVSVLALAIGVTSIVIPFTWQRRLQTLPLIHDITTDLDNPPAFQAVIARRADAPNRLDRSPQLAELQREGYPDLAPITLPGKPDVTFDRALSVAQGLGWEIVTADKSSGRIEAIDTTRWFGFTDDVVVRLTPWGAGTRVDVRSVSRTGLSDLGRNARRIRRFLNELSKGT